MEESHVYHHNDATPRVDMKVERNSRGYNYEAKVVGAATVDDAKTWIDRAMSVLKSTYGVQEKAEE